MKVKVNCPIAGCGTQVQVQSLPKHLEQVHGLDGEILLRLHPGSPYIHQPELEPEPEEEISEEERKQQYDAEAAAILKAEQEKKQETEPEE